MSAFYPDELLTKRMRLDRPDSGVRFCFLDECIKMGMAAEGQANSGPEKGTKLPQRIEVNWGPGSETT